jgi:hypothetical protein
VDSANCWLSTTSRADDSAWGDDSPWHWGADRTLIGQRDRLTILSRHSGTAVELETGHAGKTERSEGVAGWTGLEPAASGVTGRRSNQLNYHPKGTFNSGPPSRAAFRRTTVLPANRSSRSASES